MDVGWSSIRCKLLYTLRAGGEVVDYFSSMPTGGKKAKLCNRVSENPGLGLVKIVPIRGGLYSTHLETKSIKTTVSVTIR